MLFNRATQLSHPSLANHEWERMEAVLIADLVHQDALDLLRIRRVIDEKLAGKNWSSPFTALVDLVLLAQGFEKLLVERANGTTVRQFMEHTRIWSVDAAQLDHGVSRVLGVQREVSRHCRMTMLGNECKVVL
jgi:hypothetical protein